jgi:hypothetical protein
MKILNLESRPPDRDSNTGPSENEAKLLPTLSLSLFVILILRPITVPIIFSGLSPGLHAFDETHESITTQDFY